MARAIVHMDLDTFFVSCERLTNSALKDIPLIVGGGSRGVVASCSYEEEEFNTKQNFEIENLDYNNYMLKEGDTLFEGEPIPPKGKDE